MRGIPASVSWSKYPTGSERCDCTGLTEPGSHSVGALHVTNQRVGRHWVRGQRRGWRSCFPRPSGDIVQPARADEQDQWRGLRHRSVLDPEVLQSR